MPFPLTNPRYKHKLNFSNCHLNFSKHIFVLSWFMLNLIQLCPRDVHLSSKLIIFILSNPIVFSCGYNQEVPDSIHLPYTDGVLGLADGKSSIISQLHELGLTRNILGHCLSTKGGGFLFIGDDDLVPSSGVVWTPMLHNPSE